MLRKVGCIQEGIRRQVYYTNGTYSDSILYGMTKDEYVQHLRREHRSPDEARDNQFVKE
ncbi:GNAT family protein [Paenibacillus solanacearum]|nr:GNAT family protein [Paenibacillus solanacearum]